MADAHPGEGDPTRSMYNPPGAKPEPPLLKRGDVLEERFEIIQFLARGGMGEVYEAADRQMQGKHLALKTLRPEGAFDAVMRQRFEREALLAREVHHANVCPTYDLFRIHTSSGELLFLTMKLLRGEPLSARLSRLGAVPAAVSYTHLDVYKRQVLYDILSRTDRGGHSVWLTHTLARVIPLVRCTILPVPNRNRPC